MYSVPEKKFSDYMGCSQNEEILAQLDTQGGEKVAFSCVVIKFNRWNLKQDRTLLLTNFNLYNIKKNQVQRKINISSVKAVTKSTKPDNQQFIVHVRSEYDYQFESDFRKEFFDAFKYVYFLAHKTNLPVYGVPDKLKDYATSKKDISNGVEVNPQEQFRLHKEDIYDDQSSFTAPSTNMSASSSTGSFDEIHQFNNEFKAVRSDTLFMKDKKEKKVDLKDFIIKSVIGRGSFGKVFLVQKAQDGKVYAMKSLRKDVIIDYDQIESTLLEKKILLEADHPFLVGMEYVFQTD